MMQISLDTKLIVTPCEPYYLTTSTNYAACI